MSLSFLFNLVSVVGAFLVGLWLPLRLIGINLPDLMTLGGDATVVVVAGINAYMSLKKLHRTTLDLVSVSLDILCLIPFSLITYAIYGEASPWTFYIDLLCIRHVSHIRSVLDRIDSLQPITYRLIPVMTFLPLLVHNIACGWIALGSGTAGTNPDHFLEYSKAIYWAFSTLTTVGYGDISAATPIQMLYACGVQVLGVGVFGFILSNVASLLARSDAARENHMDNLDRAETFMRIHDIPPELRTKIRAYYSYLWTHKKGYLDNSLLQGLPEKIQSELWLHINKTIVERVPFLKGASAELIEDLMHELKPRIYVPGERVFRAGDPGDALYFIHHGSVEILTRDQQVLATLSDGSFFGEMALISASPRNATVKATSFCDLYFLSRESFDKVTTAYPQFRIHLEDTMKARQAA